MEDELSNLGGGGAGPSDARQDALEEVIELLGRTVESLRGKSRELLVQHHEVRDAQDQVAATAESRERRARQADERRQKRLDPVVDKLEEALGVLDRLKAVADTEAGREDSYAERDKARSEELEARSKEVLEGLESFRQQLGEEQNRFVERTEKVANSHVKRLEAHKNNLPSSVQGWGKMLVGGALVGAVPTFIFCLVLWFGFTPQVNWDRTKHATYTVAVQPTGTPNALWMCHERQQMPPTAE